MGPVTASNSQSQILVDFLDLSKQTRMVVSAKSSILFALQTIVLRAYKSLIMALHKPMANLHKTLIYSFIYIRLSILYII
jgi:hypothetical protein